MSENELENTAMATSPPAKASNGLAKTAADASRSLSVAQNPMDTNSRGLMLRNMDEMWRFATAVTKAKMAPRSLDSTEKVFIALQMGAEVGLTPMQSLKNIAVVNNSPAMWGDALVALVRRSPACEWIRESWAGAGETRKAIVTAKRRGDSEPCSREFGYADAKRAGLLSKDTYKSYPDRMFQNRARAWVLRDLFPDLLMGLDIAEEAQDAEFAVSKPSITSGDDAPLNSLDDAANLLAADDDIIEQDLPGDYGDPMQPTPEELREMEAANGELFHKGGPDYR